MAARAQTTIDRVLILKHLLIKDTARYARNMAINRGAAEYLSQLVTECIFDIQENMANCQTLTINPLNPFLFLFKVGFGLLHLDNSLTDAYLIRAVEDVYRRVRLALYNDEPVDFNDPPGLSNHALPWAIVDIDAYACKWRIDVSTATEICNWLVEVYEAAKGKGATSTPFNPPQHPILNTDLPDVFQNFTTMSSIELTKLAEDIYARFRYINLQHCSLGINSSSNLDFEAQLQMFYKEQKRLQNAGVCA